jgi:hypothetical protein
MGVIMYKTVVNLETGLLEVQALSAEEADIWAQSVAKVIPSVVTMRQARLALLETSKLHLVDLAIDSLPSPQKEAAQIEWEYSGEVHRNKEFVLLLGAALGLTSEDLDNLFLLASTK